MSPPVGQAMDRARAEGFTWRQIAQALDEGDTPEDGRPDHGSPEELGGVVTSHETMVR